VELAAVITAEVAHCILQHYMKIDEIHTCARCDIIIIVTQLRCAVRNYVVAMTVATSKALVINRLQSIHCMYNSAITRHDTVIGDDDKHQLYCTSQTIFLT